MAARKTQKIVQLRPDTRPLERRIDDYIADGRAKPLLSKTLKFYEAVLRKQRGSLLEYCRDQGVTELSGIDEKFLDGWTTWLHERPALPTAPGVEPRTKHLSAQTTATYVRTVKTFLGWAQDEGYLTTGLNLRKRPKVPRVDPQLYDVLSKAEAERMENTAKNERDKLLIRVLWETGMRASELCGYGNEPAQGLREKDLIEKGREYFLRVRGKGGKMRDVPVMPDTYRRLRRYTDNARSDPSLEALWQGRNLRDPKTDQIVETLPMTPSGLGQMLQSVAERAGIDKRKVHPHAWRHSAATNMLAKNMNPVVVKDILGHTSMRMIEQVYAHITPSARYKSYREAMTRPDEDD